MCPREDMRRHRRRGRSNRLRSEEHTSELQSQSNIICRLLLEKKINTILHELNPLFTINVTMRDITSKNVYSRVTSKATTQWSKTDIANVFHIEERATANRRS